MTFKDFGFKKFINDCLDNIGIFNPTQIQEKVIPYFKKNHNIIGKSDTGSGKTFAFLLPILNNIDYTKTNLVQATILVPTRELASQIYKVTKEFSKYEERLSVGLFIGGDSISEQERKLTDKQPHIAICTPSRLRKLYDSDSLRVTTSNYFVIDECDMIFDLGFIEDIDLIISKLKSDVKKLVFSATISEEYKVFLEKYFRNSLFIEVKNNKITNKNIENILVWTKNRENKEILYKILDNINPYICLIFVNKATDVKNVEEWLIEKGIKPAVISGKLESNKRMSMFKKINNLDYRYVICTDLASRGIDIKGISHIISFDLPNDLSYYTHRSGRTGRADQKGVSYVLHNSKNNDKIEKLKKMGVIFSNYKFNGNELVSIDKKENKKSKPKVEDANIKLIRKKFEKQKVKPGYKKKLKQEIDEYKRKKRREHIKESINKIKKEKYNKRRENLFDNKE